MCIRDRSEIVALADGATAPSRLIAFKALVGQSSNQRRLGRPDLARETLNAARDMLDTIRPEKPSSSFMKAELSLLSGFISVERICNDDWKAIELGQEAEALLSQIKGNVVSRSVESNIYAQLGICYARLGQREKAEQIISKGLDIERVDSGELSSRYVNQLSLAAHAWSFLDKERAYEYCLHGYENNVKAVGLNRNCVSGLINLAKLSGADVPRRREHSLEAFRVLNELRQNEAIGDAHYVNLMLAIAQYLRFVDEMELFDQSIELASDVIQTRVEQASSNGDADIWKRLEKIRDAIEGNERPVSQ